MREATELSPIAIIGMACLFPQAPDLESYWHNIIQGVDAIGEPKENWEAKRYLDSGRISTSYGGYLKDLYRFDPQAFSIMPNSVDGGEPDQYLALKIAYDALLDAGYADDPIDHSETGIILGHSTYLHRGQGNHIQNHIVLDQTLELIQAILPDTDEEQLHALRRLMQSKLVASNADIAPGLVPNVMTGRIANRLNLKGPNYLIDAACSSSLLAINAAIDELRTGRSRMMLTGGVNASLPAEVAAIFTQLGALSLRGKVRPFEQGSDGTLLGEGLGIIVLKRLDDAIYDQDKIYAVIRGIGQSSDGQGHGLLAPSVEGEALAIQRAYQATGIDPQSIGLVEAHGTGIPLGDQTEITALKSVFGMRQSQQGYIALGSVKSMISHCIPAAGIAGLIKSVLALQHRVLPPTLCDQVNPDLALETTPFYVNTQMQPWLHDGGQLRRAANNSFGFGGINAHAIVEQAPESGQKPPSIIPWSAELCVFSADSIQQLHTKLSRLQHYLSDDLAQNSPLKLVDYAATLFKTDTQQLFRLAIVATNKADLNQKIQQAQKKLARTNHKRWCTRNGISFAPKPFGGKLAFIFPGEGSQYIGMMSNLACYFEEVRQWFDFWQSLYAHKRGESRTDIIFPPASELTSQRRQQLEAKLYSMDIGSEAVFIASQAMCCLLDALAIHPDAMLGHSTGESSALAASGAINAKNLPELANFIVQLNQVYQNILTAGKIPVGTLLTVGALSADEIARCISETGLDIVITMDNCLNQQILFGKTKAIQLVQQKLTQAGGICSVLPFDRGYHSSHFLPVTEAFLDYYQSVAIKSPTVTLYSCASADLFPADKPEMLKLAADQWSQKVRFRETIEKMYSNGIRCFVEVGPSANLSAFVNDILAGQDHLMLATDNRSKEDISPFLTSLSQLYVNGRTIRLDRLFQGRKFRTIDFDQPVQKDLSGRELINTIPIIHFDSNDRQYLQGLFADRPIPVVEDNIDSENSNAVWQQHFSLMQDFLYQQQTVIQSWVERHVSVENQYEKIPFLSTLVEQTEGYLSAQCELSVREANFLRDHILSGQVAPTSQNRFGLSCIPLMVSLEIMAEACLLLARLDRGVSDFNVIENIKTYDWIALDDEVICLDISANCILTAKSCFYRGQISCAGKMVLSADFWFNAAFKLSALPDLSTAQKFLWQDSQLYQTGMFHGEIFQSIARIEGWSLEGIDASLADKDLKGFFSSGERPEFVFNPVLLDAFGQLAAFWTAQQVGTDFNCFPSTIERIEFYQPCPESITGLQLKARQMPGQVGDNPDTAKNWQFECLTASGQTLIRLTHLHHVFFPVPHNFYQVRKDPLNGWLGQPCQGVEHPGLLVWELEFFTEAFCSQSGSIFLRILAAALLSETELTQWQQLPNKVAYRRQWLFGRACLKEATRYWVYQQTGQLLYPSEVLIDHDQYGAPQIKSDRINALLSVPQISLSHSQDYSIAAVSPAEYAVGIDFENYNKIKDLESFLTALTDQERLLIMDNPGNATTEWLLAIWCAKEAAAKFWGSGLQGRPEQFEVSLLRGEWQKLQVCYQTKTVNLMMYYLSDKVIAIAYDGCHSNI